MPSSFLSVLAAVATVVLAASMPKSAQSKPVAPAVAEQPAAQSAAITIASTAVTETALLVNTLDGWKIAHLHASSRATQPRGVDAR